jgi:hypothetical protein
MNERSSRFEFPVRMGRVLYRLHLPSPSLFLFLPSGSSVLLYCTVSRPLDQRHTGLRFLASFCVPDCVSNQDAASFVFLFFVPRRRRPYARTHTRPTVSPHICARHISHAPALLLLRQPGVHCCATMMLLPPTPHIQAPAPSHFPFPLPAPFLAIFLSSPLPPNVQTRLISTHTHTDSHIYILNHYTIQLTERWQP